MTPIQLERRAAFMAAVVGVPAHKVTRALNKQTPGVDWAKCSKGHMAERYAKEHDTAQHVTRRLLSLDLVKLADDAKK